MLQEGLTIIGRQISVEGGRLDLLALDMQGRWVVIEIKPDAVRRETVAQALDYASCIATMPYTRLAEKTDPYLQARSTSLQAVLKERGAIEAAQEDRDVTMIVVGTGKDPGLEPMINFLAEKFEMPISAVLYDVFELEDGQRILVREIGESEGQLPDRERKQRVTVEDVCRVADKSGVGQNFRRILEAGQEYNLYPRPYATSIMYTSPANRSRMLFTVWANAKADRSLKTYIGPAAFAEFYPVTEETVIEILGVKDGYKDMTSQDVEMFLANLNRLFEIIQQGA